MEPVALPLCAPSDTIEEALSRLSLVRRTALVMNDGERLSIMYSGRLLDARDAGKITLGEVSDREPLDRSAVSSTGVELGLVADDPPRSLYPAPFSTNLEAAVASLVFDPLFRVGESGQVLPVLADELPTKENKGITAGGVMFQLRPSLKWHDGTACTSLDVAASWNAFAKQHPSESGFALDDLVDEIDTPDEKTISFRLPKSLSPNGRRVFIESLRAMNVVHSGSDETVPLGTGPFKIADWTAGRHIELIANVDYPLSATLLDRIVIDKPNSSVRLAPLESLDVDTMLQAAPNLYNVFTPRRQRLVISMGDLFQGDLASPPRFGTRNALASIFRRSAADTPPDLLSVNVVPPNSDIALMFDTPRFLRCDGRVPRHRYPDPPAFEGERCRPCSRRGDTAFIWWE